jgi:hypothetical protein
MVHTGAVPVIFCRSFKAMHRGGQAATPVVCFHFPFKERYQFFFRGKKIKLGNAGQDKLLDVWESPRISKLRNKLIQGDRSDSPCKECNTDGTFHGFNHVKKWMSIK